MNMNCPSCRSQLQNLEFKTIQVDQCKVCRGIWLDKGEVDQLFSLKEIPHRLINSEVYHSPDQLVPEGHRTCPRCNTFLKLVPIDGIKLDVCSDCHGFFTDIGELKQLAKAAENRYEQENFQKNSSE